jgi:hypothetical protein
MSSSQTKPKTKFTEDEDSKLKILVTQYGTYNWKAVARQMETKTERQVKERWYGYLDPCISTQDWAEEEDHVLLAKYNEFGSKWTKISKCFRNRTDIQCKNRFQKLQRKVKRMNQLMTEIEKIPIIKQMPHQEKRAPELCDDDFDRLFATSDFHLDEFDFFF